MKRNDKRTLPDDITEDDFNFFMNEALQNCVKPFADKILGEVKKKIEEIMEEANRNMDGISKLVDDANGYTDPSKLDKVKNGALTRVNILDEFSDERDSGQVDAACERAKKDIEEKYSLIMEKINIANYKTYGEKIRTIGNQVSDLFVVLKYS